MKVRGLCRVRAILTIWLVSSVACGFDPHPPDPCEGVQCAPGEVCVGGSCVPDGSGAFCSQDADCPSEKPICYAGVCRACSTDGECGDGQVCAAGQCRPAPTSCLGDQECVGYEKPHCDLSRGVCVECTEDPHCLALGELCDRSLGACFLPVYCLSDDDCVAVTGRGLCEPASAICVGCLTDDDCDTEAREACDTGTFSCKSRSPCRDDSDCDGSDVGRCDVSTGDCVECLDEQDCVVGTGRACHPDSRTCVGGVTCLSNEDCVDAAHPRCSVRLGLCVNCLGSSDCPMDGSTCDVRARACRPPLSCTDASDCRDSDTPLCDQSTSYCVECLSGEDCSSVAAACVLGVCDPGPPSDGRPGSACEEAAGCALASATGLESFCLVSGENEWRWHEGYCTASCDAKNDCPTGSICLGGICMDRCEATRDCRLGYACLSLYDGTERALVCAPSCEPSVAHRLPCETDGDCGLGTCDVSAGRCVCSPVGGPCAGLGYCDPEAYCIEEAVNGQPTGFTGGYCVLLGCDDPEAPPCPAGSTCLGILGPAACLPSCDPNDAGSCSRGEHGCRELESQVLGGACFTANDCPPHAPDCVGAAGGIGECIRLCASSTDCDTSKGHVCRNADRRIFFCSDSFDQGVCLPGCSRDRDCGRCAADADCSGGTACIEGSCQTPCVSEASCPDGHTCALGRCARSCVDDTDCSRGSGCEDGACSTVSYFCDQVTRRCDPPCRTDLDCDRARLCNTNTGRCVTPCDDPEACGPVGICDAERLVCEVDCRKLPGACDDGFYCDVATGTCHARCAAHDDCEPHLRCDSINGECVLPCANIERPCHPSTESEDCGEDEMCHEGYCAVSCEEDVECSPGQSCLEGACLTCRPPRERCDAEGSLTCVSCFADEHCGGSEYCDVEGSFECMERCGGVEGGTANCAEGEICDVESGGRCTRPCQTPSDCEADSARPHCHLETGLCGECGEDSHCATSARPRCLLEEPRCVGCLQDADCEHSGAGPACDPASLSCVGCTSDEHCEGEDPLTSCHPLLLACVQCLIDTACPRETPKCDQVSFHCLGCEAHDDCRPDDLCHPGVDECHPPCGLLVGATSRWGIIDVDSPNTFVTEDGARATSLLFATIDQRYGYSMSGAPSAELTLIGFPFSVPSGATLRGIEARAVASTTASTDDDWRLAVRLRDSSGTLSDPRVVAVFDEDEALVLGGDGDLWGMDLSWPDLADTRFGVMLEVFDIESSATGRVRVDALHLTAIYTTPAPTDCQWLELDEPLHCREDNLCHVSD